MPEAAEVGLRWQPTKYSDESGLGLAEAAQIVVGSTAVQPRYA